VSEQTYGLLLTSTAAGSLLGVLLAERIEGLLGRAGALWLAYLVTAVTIATPTVTTTPIAVGVALFTGGVGVVVAAARPAQQCAPTGRLGHEAAGWSTRAGAGRATGVHGRRCRPSSASVGWPITGWIRSTGFGQAPKVWSFRLILNTVNK
jgi:hypothetical protein